MSKEYVCYDVDGIMEIDPYSDKREYEKSHVESHYVEYTDGVATGVATVTEHDEIAETFGHGEHFHDPEYLNKSVIGKTKEEVEKVLSENIEKGAGEETGPNGEEKYYHAKYSEKVSSNEEFRKAKIEEIRRKRIEEGRELSDERFYEYFQNCDELQKKAASLDAAVSRVERKARRKGEKIELSADDIAKIRFNEYKKMKKEHV